MRLLCLILVALLLSTNSTNAAPRKSVEKAVPAPLVVSSDMNVGAFYFPGWSHADRWDCIAANDKVQHPLLGYYREGDPNAADWHIKWAREHGVSFFAFDFYTEGGSQYLETALDDGFLKSRYIERFKFCLNWCNHGPVNEMTSGELESFGDLVIKKYLTHPSYLRIDGKPVVIILSGYSFVKNLGVDAARREFQHFKQRCSDAGLKGAYLVFCEGQIIGPNSLKESLAAGADAFCLYNFPYIGTTQTGPGKHAEYTYQHMIEKGSELRNYWMQVTGGAFWPTVMPGWDRRPWCKDADLIRTGSTPELLEKDLRSARKQVNKDRVVMIEAWNEWGEGSVLEPSSENRFAYLDKVRNVFCPASPKHSDTDPKSLGMPLPAFNLKLPMIDRWKFDFDTEGWSGTNVVEMHNAAGAIAAKSSSGDPQLNSPKTYLKSSDYKKLHLRMRLSKLDKVEDSGQVLWSTVELSMSEKTSATFAIFHDGKWHDYEIDLTANPNWRGTMDQLRIDPGSVNGAEIFIDEIMFVR